jgi:hypothetical protein
LRRNDKNQRDHFWHLQKEDFMIPEEKNAAVGRALRETFGVSDFEDIQMLTAGLSSARIFRIVVARRPYLLRVIMSTNTAAGPGRATKHATSPA